MVFHPSWPTSARYPLREKGRWLLRVAATGLTESARGRCCMWSRCWRHHCSDKGPVREIRRQIHAYARKGVLTIGGRAGISVVLSRALLAHHAIGVADFDKAHTMRVDQVSAGVEQGHGRDNRNRCTGCCLAAGCCRATGCHSARRLQCDLGLHKIHRGSLRPPNQPIGRARGPMKIQAPTRAKSTACAWRQPKHGTAVVISSRPGSPRSGEQQVPERPPILPEVGVKVALVSRKNPAAPRLLCQHHQRSVRQVHRQIRVVFHQFLDAG